MTCIGNGMGLAAFLLFLAYPQVLLGLDSAPAARQLFCKTRQSDAGPDWLVRGRPNGTHGMRMPLGPEGHDFFGPNSLVRLGGLMQSEPGHTTSTGEQSSRNSAAICGLEFAGALVASSAGIAGAFLAASAIYNKGDAYVPAAAVLYGGSVLSSVFLSALGTHFMGGLLGRRGKFSHALVGGAVGGIAGDIVLLQFLNSGQHGEPSWPLLPIGLALPAAGSAIGYNLWRDNERE